MENIEASAVSTIEISDQEETKLFDNNIETPLAVIDENNILDKQEEDLPLLSSLAFDVSPIMALPPDAMADLYYPQKHELKCTLCKSNWRVRAEHIYLDQGRKPQAVVLFFKRYFGARVTWECVDTHMRNHCDFRRISSSGLKNLELRQDDMLQWQYREIDLAITGILAEIDDIRGMSIGDKPELMLKRSTLLKGLYKDLADFHKLREEKIGESINIFEVLHDIFLRITDQESKQIIVEKVNEIKRQLV